MKKCPYCAEEIQDDVIKCKYCGEMVVARYSEKKTGGFMKILLFIFSVLAFLVGLGILGLAKSSIHEIEALILLLISAVYFSACAIVEAVNSQKR